MSSLRGVRSGEEPSGAISAALVVGRVFAHPAAGVRWEMQVVSPMLSRSRFGEAVTH